MAIWNSYRNIDEFQKAIKDIKSKRNIMIVKVLTRATCTVITLKNNDKKVIATLEWISRYKSQTSELHRSIHLWVVKSTLHLFQSNKITENIHQYLWNQGIQNVLCFMIKIHKDGNPYDQYPSDFPHLQYGFIWTKSVRSTWKWKYVTANLVILWRKWKQLKSKEVTS
jgi:hypothetical protein